MSEPSATPRVCLNLRPSGRALIDTIDQILRYDIYRQCTRILMCELRGPAMHAVVHNGEIFMSLNAYA